MPSKSDRDGYDNKGMKYKQMDRWKSEYNGKRRVRKYSDVKDLKEIEIRQELLVLLYWV